MEEPAVKLIIKAPNQQVKDQIVNCDIEWTIGRLKKYLTEVYPNKPESKCQKLIYSGQLLKDADRLKDVLRQHDGIEQAYTIHLVCAPQKWNATKTTTEQTQPITDSNAPSLVTNTNEPVRPNHSENQRLDTNQTLTQPAPIQLYSTHPYFDPHNTQQLALMQQAYTHYMTQYMQLMAAHGIQLQTTIPYVQHSNDNNESFQNTYINNNNSSNSNNNNNNNIGDEQQPDDQRAADLNIEIIIAPDEGALHHDWLDLFYILSRMIVLCSIVYVYSSPSRFLIVTFLGFAMYLYQGGFFRAQPVLIQDLNNGRVDNNNQVLQNDAGGNEAMAQQNAHIPNIQPETRTNINEENQERPGVLAFTWTFFTSFFASLIPDQPNIL